MHNWGAIGDLSENYFGEFSFSIKYYQGVTSGESDSLFTITCTQTRFNRQDVSPVNHEPANLIQTEDLEPWFEENSNLYVISGESLSKTSAQIGLLPVMHEMPILESIH